MALRGIRGATTVLVNTQEAVLEATRELLLELQQANGFDMSDLAAAWFTATPDLHAAFPARAARQLGWVDVPLMDAQEIDVPGSLQACIRVLILWNTDRKQSEICHAYLHGAGVLRPELARQPGSKEER